MKNKYFLLVFFWMFASTVNAKTEMEYVRDFCPILDGGGVIEAKMPDNSRCDCLTKHYAIEFDFAPKWAEAIGQSLLYAKLTEKQAGIVLIIRKSSEYKQWQRLQEVIRHFKLPIFVAKIEDLEDQKKKKKKRKKRRRSLTAAK